MRIKKENEALKGDSQYSKEMVEIYKKIEEE
jgi:hypothetical protein